MATYYKYEKAEDISKSMIDWTGLTKNISDNLMTEKKRRDDLKFKHDTDNAKQLLEIEKFEQGLDPTLNAKMLEYSQSYKQYLLENHKLMKSGLITVNDAMLIKQNATDSWANMNLATKTFNDKLQLITDAGGNVNDFIAEQAINIFDLKNKKLFINDQGVASVGNIKEDGSVDQNTVVPWTKLNQVTSKKYDRFDMGSEVLNVTKTAAEWKVSPTSTRTVTDVRNNPNYKVWKTNTIKEILNSDDKIIAAAADSLQMSPTTDAELVKSNPNSYFLVEMVNGMPKFDVDSIKGKVEEAVGNRIEMALGHEETKTEASAFSQQLGIDKRTKAKNLELLANYLSKGDQTSASALINATGITGIDNTSIPGKIMFIDASGNKSAPVDKSGNIVDVLKGLAGTVGVESNLVTELSNKYKKLNLASNFENITGRTAAPEKISSDIINDIDKAFGYNIDKDGGKTGGMSVGKMSKGVDSLAKDVISKVALAAQSIGLDSKNISYSDGTAKYGDIDLGSNGASIAQSLQSIKEGKQSSNLNATNLNATNRKK